MSCYPALQSLPGRRGLKVADVKMRRMSPVPPEAALTAAVRLRGGPEGGRVSCGHAAGSCLMCRYPVTLQGACGSGLSACSGGLRADYRGKT